MTIANQDITLMSRNISIAMSLFLSLTTPGKANSKYSNQSKNPAPVNQYTH